MGKRIEVYSVGKRFITKTSGWLYVIKYENYKNITVKFEDTGYETTTTGCSIRNGTVKDPYVKSVYGVGFIGEGEPPSLKNPAYVRWRNMIRRCYAPYEDKRSQTYKDCVVCDEWHNFQTFARWFWDNQKGDGYHLDKDILHRRCGLYSPSTCEFIPSELNLIFAECTASRGDCPKGVSFDKDRSLYAAYCRISGKKSHKYLGRFKSKEEAFYAYKHTKEDQLKHAADRYYEKGMISKEMKDALYRYEILMED